MENEIYDFIVGSNLEYSIVNQASNKKVKKELKIWLQI